MERLTQRNSQGIAVYKQSYDCERCGEGLWRLPDLGNGSPTDKLAAYEDAEEQGLLLRLPCKVGDMVYILAGRFGTFYEIDICDGFYIGRDGILQVKVQNKRGNHSTYGVMGKTVFLTKEEAEAALKEMKGEERE